MRRRFFTLDVFTNRRYAGNPLAVVLDPQDLSGEAMQAIAREFNLSETVFAFPPQQAAHRARLRIFTPARELPFAGHPTIGTAVLMAKLDGRAAGQCLVLEEGIGPVACRIAAVDNDGGRAIFDLPQLPAQGSPLGDTEGIAAALGLAADDIGFAGFRPGQWSAGNPLAFVPLRSLDAVRRSRADLSRWDTAFAGNTGAFIFCGETVERTNAFHARMFAPSFGIAEDPATGSAVAALAGIIAAQGEVTDGDHEFVIEQGYEMGRPSLITLSLVLQGRKLTAASIAGDAVIVSEGMIEA